MMVDAACIPLTSLSSPGSSPTPFRLLLRLQPLRAAHTLELLLKYFPLSVACLLFAHPNCTHLCSSFCADPPSLLQPELETPFTQPGWHPHFAPTWHLIINGLVLNNILATCLPSLWTEKWTSTVETVRTKKSSIGKLRHYQL